MPKRSNNTGDNDITLEFGPHLLEPANLRQLPDYNKSHR